MPQVDAIFEAAALAANQVSSCTWHGLLVAASTAQLLMMP